MFKMFDLVLQEPEGVSKAQNLSFEVFCLRWNKIIDIAYCTKAVNNEVALKKQQSSIEATAKCEFFFEKEFALF
jgi:hypothetical protein